MIQNPDLSPRWIFVKAILFCVLLVLSGAALIVEERLGQRALFLLATIWSSARLYYFMFYVIEKYVDPT